MLGVTQEEFGGGTDMWQRRLHPEDRERVLAQVTYSRRSGMPFASEYRLLAPDDRAVWVRDQSVLVRDSSGEPLYFQGVLFDISDRKLAEEHVHTLSQQLMKAQENERRRISRDLHDHVAQDLSTLKIASETLFEDSSSLPPDVRQRVAQFSKILQEAIGNVREIIYDLRPPYLDEMGLVQAIFQYCRDFSEKSGFEIDFSAAGMDNVRMGFDAEINLYRLVQEALNNIKKHADAKHVTIRMVASSPHVILRIEDDGKGFAVEERLLAAMGEKRMGLRSMEERVNQVQGRMTIQSRPTLGTKIFIEIPYE